MNNIHAEYGLMIYDPRHTFANAIAALEAFLSVFLIGQFELRTDAVAMVLDSKSITSMATLYRSMRFVMISINESLRNSWARVSGNYHVSGKIHC